jgi:lysophospholipase L1-like esterase
VKNTRRTSPEILRFFKTVTFTLAFFVLCSAMIFGESANHATTEADRLNEPWWAERHKAILDSIQHHPDTQLLMIGDSITNNYDKSRPPDENFLPTWQQFYEPRKALNLGFSGDTTAHVLWRIGHGEVDGLHPKVAVLLIGTNNTGHGDTTEETETGIDAVITELENHLPGTHILLLGILPSAISDNKTERDRAVNRYLATCYSENPQVTYLDIGSIFYKHGAINDALFYDPRLPQHGKPLHPDTNGQRMMAEAIEPTLARLMHDTPQQPLASMTDINTAVIPVERLEGDVYDWYARHHAELDLIKHLQPRVVLIGDSITHFWGGLPNGTTVNGVQAWQKTFGGMPVINMGFGWDRTQNVLWRLRQGEFDGLHPQWVVLAIGTNNLTGTDHARASTPQEIVEGIDAICKEISQRSPESHVVLMAIFPRGAKPTDPRRAPIRQTNKLLAERFANNASITFLDIAQQFLAPDGSLPADLFPDGTHPAQAGYQIWGDAFIKAGIRP